VYIPGSTRADGSKRPDIKVKPGYTPQELVPSYVIPQKSGPPDNQDTKNNGVEPSTQQPTRITVTESRFPPGMDPDLIKRIQEEEEKKKAKKRIRKKKDNVNNEEETKGEEPVQAKIEAKPQTQAKEQAQGQKDEAGEKKQGEKKKKGLERKESNVSKDSKGISGEDPEVARQHKIRNLKKKLKGIEGLEEKKRTAGSLNADELAKVATKKEVLIKLKDLQIK